MKIFQFNHIILQSTYIYIFNKRGSIFHITNVFKQFAELHAREIEGVKMLPVIVTVICRNNFRIF
jgi:hypothetical protein